LTFRDIGEDPDSRFLNWSDEHGGNGTAYLAVRTRKAWAKLKIELKLVDEEMIVKTKESEYKKRTAMGIGRFLTQKVIPLTNARNSSVTRSTAQRTRH
jgi:hypothetical protein